jgi:hypothetical protein
MNDKNALSGAGGAAGSGRIERRGGVPETGTRECRRAESSKVEDWKVQKLMFRAGEVQYLKLRRTLPRI